MGSGLGLAGQIVEALSNNWKSERYHDTYTEQLRSLIKKRSKGHAAEPQPDREPRGGHGAHQEGIERPRQERLGVLAGYT